MLFRTTFIGITGSCGKTTTKDITAALLSAHFTGVKSSGSFNMSDAAVHTLQRTRFNHDFAVQEFASWGPGTIAAGLRFFRPRIGVVLTVRHDHYKAFHGLEHTQREKARLVEALPKGGTAILNRDDPRVWEMASATPARVLSFGTHSQANLCASRIRADWPRRLSFVLTYAGEQTPVHTQLIGKLCLHSVLAAMGVALTMGVPMGSILSALERTKPSHRRMSYHPRADGVEFIRDDNKATMYSMPDVIDFLARANARRKILVVGNLSDYPGSAGNKYRGVARAAREHIDKTVFVGSGFSRYLRLREEDTSGAVVAFSDIQQASVYVNGFIRAGDLVLIKSSKASHLERIIFHGSQDVRCWRIGCGHDAPCDRCPALLRGEHRPRA